MEISSIYCIKVLEMDFQVRFSIVSVTTKDQQLLSSKLIKIMYLEDILHSHGNQQIPLDQIQKHSYSQCFLKRNYFKKIQIICNQFLM